MPDKMCIRACIAGPYRDNRLVMADLLTTFEYLIAKYGGREQLIKSIKLELQGENRSHHIPTLHMTRYEKIKVKLLRETIEV